MDITPQRGRTVTASQPEMDAWLASLGQRMDAGFGELKLQLVGKLHSTASGYNLKMEEHTKTVTDTAKELKASFAETAASITAACNAKLDALSAELAATKAELAAATTRVKKLEEMNTHFSLANASLEARVQQSVQQFQLQMDKFKGDHVRLNTVCSQVGELQQAQAATVAAAAGGSPAARSISALQQRVAKLESSATSVAAAERRPGPPPPPGPPPASAFHNTGEIVLINVPDEAKGRVALSSTEIRQGVSAELGPECSVSGLAVARQKNGNWVLSGFPPQLRNRLFTAAVKVTQKLADGQQSSRGGRGAPQQKRPFVGDSLTPAGWQARSDRKRAFEALAASGRKPVWRDGADVWAYAAGEGPSQQGASDRPQPRRQRVPDAQLAVLIHAAAAPAAAPAATPAQASA